MRFKLILLSLFICLQTFGSHIAGGEITYEYFGTTTNGQSQYTVTLRIFRDMTGIPLPAQANIQISSSCAVVPNVTAGRRVPPPHRAAGDGGFTIENFSICANQNSNIPNYSIHYYDVVVTLPVKCADWEFYWTSCCRNPAISTIQSPSGQGYIVSATLNNLQGENNTPTGSFADDVRMYCVNSNVTIFPYTEESDKDSLVFSLTDALDDPAPGTPLTYLPGYSSQSPVTSSTPITIDPSTGVINFSPTQAEIAVIAVKVEEWRKDTANGNYYLISELQKDMQIIISNQCDTSLNKWSMQTINGSPQISFQNCGDSIIHLKTPLPFQCNSLSPDGSDFLIYRPDGTLFPIISASTLCDRFYADSIALALYDSLSTNDTLILVSHIGNDFNTLTSMCGFDLREDDSITIIVQDCPNIGLTENIRNTSVYPNPFKNRFRLEFEGVETRSISIYDLKGRIIWKEESRDESVEVDLGTFANDILIVRIRHKDRIETMKLVRLELEN